MTALLQGGRLREELAGKKIVMTGVTGFIGEQILWKILTELPDTRAVVLVRPKGSVTARDRVVSLLKKPIFKELAEAAGGADALCENRVDVLSGDLPNVPELPRDLDVVIHCAGDVSFDPPIDSAFKTNVLGTQALMEAMLAACRDEQGTLARIPHYVHISTAYTAGRRRGAIPEAAHEHDVDYREETRQALAMGELVEAQSRTSEQLAELRKQAEREHRQAGFLTTAEDTERRRQAWVKAKLVEAGTERARSLGWTDVYTFAKAMGERVVADLGKDIKVSIVRPAIVESSLVHPYPGWIEGFKMADPIILAYGKGQLKEFPASPDAALDIVPCDHVVNAIVAVCATQPEIGQPEFYHCSTGARNPMTFREIYEYIREYFSQHPYTRSDGTVAPLATWKFPGEQPVERFLKVAEQAHKVGNRALSWAPRGKYTRQAATALDKQGKSLSFLRRYLSLYGEYLQSQVHFVDDRTMALHNSLHPEDVAAFAFDTSAVDWRTYMMEIHTPAITDPVRRLEALRNRRGKPSSTYKELKPAEPGTVLAAFDLDGTVMDTNVVETYLWARLPDLSPAGRVRELAEVAASLPGYLGADRRDRATFLRSIYRRYAGMEMSRLEAYVDQQMAPFVKDRLSPQAIARIQEHRDAGHVTILMTGVIRPLTRPLEDLFDVIVASELVVDDNGICTGFLAQPPMVGESRSAWLRHHAAQHGIDLAQSYAYADSHVDLPMLNAVGNPVAVQPDVGLLRAARKGGWSVVDWHASPSIQRWRLPRRAENPGN
ncbi:MULTISPECIES: HAD-IB family hydrolase [unclassified Luteococcus]|uniref:HAD-IB family hydrolase n=1 Tax=unclassified Luteococcus TaxID=2639923 RepID=UPI00313D6FC1